AAEERTDLIVMPTHAYGPFRRFLLGSVTAKVLHDANCPVWTGPHLEQAPAQEAIRFGAVVCPIDLGPESAAGRQWGARFAHEFGSALVVVHAIPHSTAHVDQVPFDESWRGQVVENARERIIRLQQQMEAPGEVVIEIGEVPVATADAVKRLGADLM